MTSDHTSDVPYHHLYYTKQQRRRPYQRQLIRCITKYVPKRYLKRRNLKYYYGIIVLLLFNSLRWMATIDIYPPEDRVETTPEANLKRILFYNKFWKQADFFVGFGHAPFLNCPETRCMTSGDHEAGPYDAIVIHGVDFVLDGGASDYIDQWREPHQRFVFFRLESPDYQWNSYDAPIYNDFFNWTMTYRHDSDVVHSYGWFEDKNKRIVYDFSNVHPDTDDYISNVLPAKDAAFHALATRPNAIAWISSHCTTSSRREVLVRQLQQYFHVSTFGACGTTPCDISEKVAGGDNCSYYVKDTFKFYLALENAFATDYATEKFIRRMAQLETIPIVLGQANYTRIAPPHSYINVLEYETLDELVAYIQKVNTNHSLYLSYFWWRDYYQVRASREECAAQAFCELCGKLWADPIPKSYPNFLAWWKQDANVGGVMPRYEQLVGNTTLEETKASPFRPPATKLRMNFQGKM
jgi:alpha-1,3-fucosyltransferase